MQLPTVPAPSIPPDAPKITDWLSVWFSLGSGVIALLALIAAAIAVWATIQTNRSQSKQLRRLEEQQARELASGFGVWIEERPLPIDDNDFAAPIRRLSNRPKYVVMYSNSGAQPMYRVEIRVALGIPGFPYAASRRYLPPTVEPTFFEEVPGSLDTYIVEGIRQQRPPEAGDDDAAGFVDFVREVHADRAEIHVAFTDANGVRWYREEGGQLARTDEQE